MVRFQIATKLTEENEMSRGVSRREKIGNLLSNPKIMALEVTVVALIAILNIFNPTILILAVAAVSLWARRKNLKDLGLSKPSKKELLLGLAVGLLLPLIGAFLIGPAIAQLTGVPTNLSLFASLKGDLTYLLVWLTVTWTLAAFGEEIAYRGYFLKRAGDFLGKTRYVWIAALLLTSVCFGFAHSYQGITGIISTGVSACIFGVLYLSAGKRLWLPIIAHGVDDTVGFIAIFAGFALV